MSPNKMKFMDFEDDPKFISALKFIFDSKICLSQYTNSIL